jgi:hypothetical protein
MQKRRRLAGMFAEQRSKSGLAIGRSAPVECFFSRLAALSDLISEEAAISWEVAKRSWFCARPSTVIKVVDHHAGRLLQTLFGNVGVRMNPMHLRAVAEMEPGHRIKRQSVLALGCDQIMGRERA